MARNPSAYLIDSLEACLAIQDVLIGVDLSTYGSKRAIRSAVEREFILIGEALRRLSQVSPELFSRIQQARLIVDFRNLLTHDYSAIDDEAVYGIAITRLDPLIDDLKSLLLERGESI